MIDNVANNKQQNNAIWYLQTVKEMYKTLTATSK